MFMGERLGALLWPIEHDFCPPTSRSRIRENGAGVLRKTPDTPVHSGRQMVIAWRLCLTRYRRSGPPHRSGPSRRRGCHVEGLPARAARSSAECFASHASRGVPSPEHHAQAHDRQVYPRAIPHAKSLGGKLADPVDGPGLAGLVASSQCAVPVAPKTDPDLHHAPHLMAQRRFQYP